jgi:hypothetical protein
MPKRRRLSAVKGDRVEVLIDVGSGVERFEVDATRAGRRVEITTGRGNVEVTEVTRSGRPVRSARFIASRVVAIVEHPVESREQEGTASSPGRSGARHRSDGEADRLPL